MLVIIVCFPGHCLSITFHVEQEAFHHSSIRLNSDCQDYKV